MDTEIVINSGLVTPKVAAKVLGVSTYTVYRWLKRGWLDGITLPNGTKRVSWTSLNRVLTESTR